MAKPAGAGDDKGMTERLEYVDPKSGDTDINVLEKMDNESHTLSQDEKENFHVPTTARDLVTEVLRVEDDPTQNPWTFRTWFIGIGLSIFAA